MVAGATGITEVAVEDYATGSAVIVTAVTVRVVTEGRMDAGDSGIVPAGTVIGTLAATETATGPVARAGTLMVVTRIGTAAAGAHSGVKTVRVVFAAGTVVPAAAAVAVTVVVVVAVVVVVITGAAAVLVVTAEVTVIPIADGAGTTPARGAVITVVVITAVAVMMMMEVTVTTTGAGAGTNRGLGGTVTTTMRIRAVSRNAGASGATGGTDGGATRNRTSLTARTATTTAVPVVDRRVGAAAADGASGTGTGSGGVLTVMEIMPILTVSRFLITNGCGSGVNEVTSRAALRMINRRQARRLMSCLTTPHTLELRQQYQQMEMEIRE